MKDLELVKACLTDLRIVKICSAFIQHVGKYHWGKQIFAKADFKSRQDRLLLEQNLSYIYFEGPKRKQQATKYQNTILCFFLVAVFRMT
jgi:hypothetical protein